MKISKDKKYKLRVGSDAKIYEIYPDDPTKWKVHGAYKSGNIWQTAVWGSDGIFANNGEESDYDLIEISPYADFKIDDRVLVWDEQPDNKRKGHFAGINNEGFPMTWRASRTSFTETITTTWNNCIKYEEQENDKI